MNHSYRVLALSMIAVLSAACSASNSNPPTSAPFGLPNISTQSASQEQSDYNYKILTSFKNTYAGSYPYGGLLDVNGKLYGTTVIGGAFGLGNVFSISTTGKEKVLHSFTGILDGSDPEGTLINVKGTLYGMAPGSGAYQWGTVYSITTSGAEKVIYNFRAPPSGDGAGGQAPAFVYVNKKLYGMTSEGGKWGRGTVFTVTTKGKEKVLLSFYGQTYDGSTPAGGMVYLNDLFYATTTSGGTNGNGDVVAIPSLDVKPKPPCVYTCFDDYGTVFSVSKTGEEKVLVTFDGSNGADPEAGLIDVDGTLYGTTAGGPYYEGTAFSITTSGYLTTLHTFGYGYDGSVPVAPLLNVQGTLYGTTSSGGMYSKGTIFKMSLNGNEEVLHSFGYGSDGSAPLGGLTDVNGTLYGTTSSGGSNGNGTVFALTLPH